jgi:hypothetical protein
MTRLTDGQKGQEQPLHAFEEAHGSRHGRWGGASAAGGELAGAD